MSVKTVKNSGKPFVKDDPRINRGGRPIGSGISITTEIKRKLKETYPDSKSKSTYLQEIINVIMEKAIKEKDSYIIKQIWNQIDGLPKHSNVPMDGQLPTPILVQFLKEKTIEKNEG